MGCTTGLIKTILFTFNFFFVLTGLVYIANGVILIRYYNVQTLDESLSIVALLSIVVGSVVFFIAFLGCCGTLKNDTCYLSTYATILITLLVMQIAAGVFIYLKFANNGELKDFVVNAMQDIFAKYDTDAVAQKFIDGTQVTLSCCGVKGPADYLPKFSPPMSCCGKAKDVCTFFNGGWKQGCAEAMFDVVKTYSKIIGNVILGISCVELVGSILVLYLISSINNHRRRFAYA